MKTLGIVGGGQLGRLLALAAKELGFKVIVLDPTPEGPGGQVADRQIVGSFKDPEAIRLLASESDHLTFEIESADADTLLILQAEGKPIHPSPQTLLIIKDKYRQKEFLREAGIPVTPAMAIEGPEDIEEVMRLYGFPFLLKARFDAYDGRGNALIRSTNDIEPALQKLGDKNLYAEKFVSFTKELAIVVARDQTGNVVPYPLVETIHKNNICHQVIVPAPVSEEVAEKASRIATRVMEVLAGVGIFGIELFLTGKGDVLVNEIAPRVHNSGHLTIEASETSQFEQHVRAVTGMPLGAPSLKVPAAVMINVLGDRSGPALLEGGYSLPEPGVHLHIYGKFETRPERKMGHLTATGDSIEEALERALAAHRRISI